MDLLSNLAKRYGNARLEAACELTLALGAFKYRHVRDVLANNRDRLDAGDCGADDYAEWIVEGVWHDGVETWVYGNSRTIWKEIHERDGGLSGAADDEPDELCISGDSCGDYGMWAAG